LPLWLLYIKKPWGLISHPWLFAPIWGIALWVTRLKIKIKVKEIKTRSHGFSFRPNLKHIGRGMSRKNFDRKNFDISEKFSDLFQLPACAR
jgi:hypothetical protein